MDIPDDFQGVIERYQLKPHPEGGWYREVHRSAHVLGSLAGYPGERAALTAIYFLLSAGDFSAFHRVRSEEAWVHLAGAPLELTLLGEEPRFLILSPAGCGEPLHVVPPDMPQAARTLGTYTLAACLVAPGFDFSDFAILPRAELERDFPRHFDLVHRFTRPD
jgi:uncharacterized protein